MVKFPNHVVTVASEELKMIAEMPVVNIADDSNATLLNLIESVYIATIPVNPVMMNSVPKITVKVVLLRVCTIIEFLARLLRAVPTRYPPLMTAATAMTASINPNICVSDDCPELLMQPL
jgi:hypothetical protein